ncbi:DUF4913 domain-containing protein [Nocardia terpenica]|uniref:DUF4913 domain-containing protein n=1 Tax=Nocardia terpenica TaxID=455432 RepID=A0A291RGZ5_9NOCA|nr:DUF4913 domain-containing protein [Nocardia terpenica]ATL66627.1 DUF4913 domain-containing protein [Nocardia terpenica]
MNDSAASDRVYDSVVEFVENYLSLVYRRDIVAGRTAWCRDWWKHAEAVIRLEALWRAWEYLRGDSRLGMSTWLLDHADPQMAALLDPHGPFEFCTIEQHSDALRPLPLTSPAPGIFGIAPKDDQT